MRIRRLAVPLVMSLLAAGVAVLGTAGAAEASDAYRSITDASPANRTWMSEIRDDARLADLSIPGTHDSLALCGYSHDGGGNGCDVLTTGITQTQENHGYSAQTLTTQLNAGIRALDIRVRVDKGNEGLTFTVHHGVYYQWANFTDVLNKIEAFLAENPRETVLLHLKAECEGNGPASCYDAEGFDTHEWRTKVFKSYLDGAFYTGDGDATRPAKAWRSLFWDKSVTGTSQADVPTLGEVRGKIVLLGFRSPSGGIYNGFGLSQPYPAGGSNEEYVQDKYEVPNIWDIAGKWETVRAHLRRTSGVWDATRPGEKEYGHKPDALYINYTSGTGSGANPYTVAGGTPTATGVNEFLIQCLRNSGDRCPEFYPDRPDKFGGQASMGRMGVMMMDFPGGKLIDEILERNPAGVGGVVNYAVGDPSEVHLGGDDGGARPGTPGDQAACRPDGMTPTAGTATPYCRVYDGNGREWLGNGRSRRVVAYFSGARHGADGKPYYLVKNIPWSKVTHLNYAFATVESNRISVGPAGSTNPATGMTWPGVRGAEMDDSLPYRGHFNLLTRYKRLHPRVKTLISVGGWAGSAGFYTMTTNADGTTNQGGINTFADSAVDFLRTYGFDGVDIDFEYPTSLDDTGNPADWGTANARRKGLPTAYTALMKTLREKLDRAAAADNRYYLLTSASSASGYLVRGMENQKALRYQDFTNLMAYDFHGTWNDVVGPNAALFDDGKDPELSELYNTPEYQKIGYFNTDWALHYLRGAVQAGRINIGVPYYTRGWRNVSGGTNGLWGASPGTGCEPGTGIKRPCGDGALGIDNIWHDLTADGGRELGSGTNPMWHAKNLEANVMPRYAPGVGLTPDTDPADRLTGRYTRHWDAATRTSWLWNPDKKTFLSTEDIQGVETIADYVKNSGAGGVMMWELSGDYECPGTVTAATPCQMGYTLTNRLNDKLNGSGDYGTSRSDGSAARPPSSAVDVTVDLVNYPGETAKLWPLTPTVRVTNNTGVTIGGGKDTTISFDLPTSTSALIKDGNWQTGDQNGQWKVAAGHTGPNAGTGLRGNFHRVSTTLDYCQIIPPGKSLDLPIIYYLPATGPVNTIIKVGGTNYAPLADNNRGAAKATPAAGGCPAPAWNASTVYDPSKQAVEAVTVKHNGKIWRAKWWTQGNVPGTGADADHEPWKLVGPAA